MIRKLFRRPEPRPEVDFNPDTDVLYVHRPDGTTHTHGPWNEDPNMILTALLIRELFQPGPESAEARAILARKLPPEVCVKLGISEPE